MQNDAPIENLYGLILAGGRSTRMQKDKSTLIYHDKPQCVFCYELLSKVCEKVFISNRQDQAQWQDHSAYPQIHDLKSFTDIGPLGGILSAMTYYPTAAWCVLACDLPFVTTEVLQELIQQRNSKKIATAFISQHDGLPEPLCAIYELQSFAELFKFFQQGTKCPRKILINSDVQLIKQTPKMALDNINDPEEYKRAMQKLKNIM